MDTPSEKQINDLIKSYSVPVNRNFDATNISDGYHTFGELYVQRAMLFIALAKQFPDSAWRFTKNADGLGFAGFFGLGIFPQPGKQITYHLPMQYLHLVTNIRHFEVNPHFDGHNSYDVIQRLASIGRVLPDTALINANQKLAASNRAMAIENDKLQASITDLEEKLQFVTEKLEAQNKPQPQPQPQKN